MKKVLLSLAVVTFFAVPAIALAQGIENPLADATFSGLLIRLTQWLLGMVAILALLGIVYGGIRMILAVGNEQGLSEAKRIVTWSVAGVIVAGLSFAIVSIVATELLGITYESHLIPVAYAQDVIGLDEAKKVGLDSNVSAKSIAGNILAFVTSIAGLIALAVFIYGAVMFILSLGDEGKAATAKKIMLYAVVGLLLVGVAYVILRVAGQIIGILGTE